MKTNDYVKYITQTVVQYIDQPKDERIKIRQDKKERKASFMYQMVWDHSVCTNVKDEEKEKVIIKRLSQLFGTVFIYD